MWNMIHVERELSNRRNLKGFDLLDCDSAIALGDDFTDDCGVGYTIGM